MQKLKVVYFGTPSFSADFLEKIVNDKDLPVEIKLVVTQPNKPVGRKQTFTPSPVKIIAQKYGLPVLDSLTLLTATPEVAVIDLAILFAFGEIIPQKILDIPRLGFWNIHPSLLPLYRGPSPIAFPLINGDKTTGVTLMQMDKELDHGPIIDQVEYEIKENDRRDDLEKKLTDLGYLLLKKTILAGVAKKGFPTRAQPAQRVSTGGNEFSDRPREQIHAQATYTKLLEKKDGFIPLDELKNSLNISVYNRFRGLYPWPGIWTLLRLKTSEGQAQEKRLKITGMKLVKNTPVITKVQLEGKKEVDFVTFNKAYKLF